MFLQPHSNLLYDCIIHWAFCWLTFRISGIRNKASTNMTSAGMFRMWWKQNTQLKAVWARGFTIWCNKRGTAQLCQGKLTYWHNTVIAEIKCVHYFSISLFEYLSIWFIWRAESQREGERQREIKREKKQSLICRFAPQMTKDPNTPSGLLCGWQGPSHPLLLF